MGRKIDIGGYFDQITKGARGGRRLDDGNDRSSPSSGSTTSGPTSGPTSSGSIRDRLKDVVNKGREAAKRSTGRSTPNTPELAPGGVVRIEYSPLLDGDPDPGDVVWIWVPFEEDPSQGKDRPVVVIGRRGSSLVGVPLTTKQNEREAQIEVGTGDWDPKRRVSYARIWRMLDIDLTAMRREGAIIDRPRFDAIVAAVDRYYDVSYATSSSSPGTSKASEADDY